MPFPEVKLRGWEIASEDRRFLCSVGLPADAAPFLSFGPSRDEAADLAIFGGGAEGHVIGKDGSGNVILISPSGIELIDHDAGFERIPVNSSVARLAGSLLAYRRFVASGGYAQGPPFDPGALGELARDLQSLDSELWGSDGLWRLEYEALVSG